MLNSKNHSTNKNSINKNSIEAENISLREQIQIEKEKNNLVFQQYQAEQDKNKKLEQQVEVFREMILDLKRHRFGKKSERWESEEQCLFIFNEAEVESSKPETKDDDTCDETITVKEYKKKRGHRKPLPSHLPREVINIELPAEERFAEDGAVLKVIGYEISEKLQYEPATLRVLEIHRAKYGVDSGDYVKTAPPEASVVPKGMATPSLLAAITVAKYADGLPLYRQEEIFARQEIELSRTTMARWMIQCSEALWSIWNVLSDRLIESDGSVNFFVSVGSMYKIF